MEMTVIMEERNAGWKIFFSLVVLFSNIPAVLLAVHLLKLTFFRCAPQRREIKTSRRSRLSRPSGFDAAVVAMW